MTISKSTLESFSVDMVSLVVVVAVLAVANLVLCELGSFRGDLKTEIPLNEGERSRECFRGVLSELSNWRLEIKKFVRVEGNLALMFEGKLIGVELVVGMPESVPAFGKKRQRTERM